MQTPEWIRSRGVNGEYGYINMRTGQFRTTLPNSDEEKRQEQIKYNKAVLTTHAARQAKFNQTEGKLRNHSDERIKKEVNVPTIAMNPDGAFYNTYVRQLAPSESPMKIVSPEFDLLTLGQGIGKIAKQMPYRFKIPVSPNNYYRVVNKEAIDDANLTGIIRHKITENNKEPILKPNASLLERLNTGSRSGGIPYFSKGKLYMASDNKAVIVGDNSIPWRRVGSKGRKNKYSPDAPIPNEASATPYYEGTFNSAPTEHFSYWERVPHLKFLWRHRKFKNPHTKFKSELNWNPEEYFKQAGNTTYTQNDIAALQNHIPEYLEIERQAKLNGTWLKMPDGSIYKGDPRNWVQLQSKDAQKLSKQVYYHGDTNVYTTPTGEDVTPIENGTRILWASSNPSVARTYTTSDERVIPLVITKQPSKTINANGRSWRSAYQKGDNYYDTNTFSNEFLKDKEYLKIENVIDPGSSRIPKDSKYYIEANPNETVVDYYKRNYTGDDLILGKNSVRKSINGNNGNFDLSNPNIYRAIAPLLTFSLINKNE